MHKADKDGETIEYLGVTGTKHEDKDGNWISADVHNGVIISGPGSAEWVLSEFKGMVEDYRNDCADYERAEFDRQEYEEEQRQLEEREMEEHFRRHPHG